MCDVPPEAWEDCFHPPSISTLVCCLHCQEVYDSYKIFWEPKCEGDDHIGKLPGFWRCPIEGCGGAGFGFDILPIEPDYIDPDGRDMGQWQYDDDEDDEDYDEEFDDELAALEDLEAAKPDISCEMKKFDEQPVDGDSQFAPDIEHELNDIMNMLEGKSAFDEDLWSDDELPWSGEESSECKNTPKKNDPFLSPSRDLFHESDG